MSTALTALGLPALPYGLVWEIELRNDRGDVRKLVYEGE
jgi:hypothetical protein